MISQLSSPLRLLAAVLGISLLLLSCSTRKGTSPSEATTVAPAQLAAQLADTTQPHPHLIHVGFAALYKSQHIPGSVYAGPGAEDRGIEALSTAVSPLPKSDPIVIYCGCCPWDNCPNVRPAFDALQKQGFTNVRILKIDDHFATDWADKGYPVE